MAQDKLILNECRDRTRICWWIDGEEGAHLGDYLSGGPSPPEDDDHYIATEAALTVEAETDCAGLYWETRAAASKALTAAKAALKAHRSAKPWPEWAKQALVAGWKAPKGWQP